MQVVTALPQRSVFPRFTPRWKLKERAVEWWAVIRSNLAPAGTCHLSAFQILYPSFGRWSLAISQRIWMFRGLNNQARYVSLCESFCIAFLAIGSINLCFEHWITGEPLAISNRPLWRAAPQMFAERTVEAQIFEDMGFPKLSSHLSSSHLKPLYPQVISSPNRFFSFPAFLTQKKLSDLSPLWSRTQALVLRVLQCPLSNAGDELQPSEPSELAVAELEEFFAASSKERPQQLLELLEAKADMAQQLCGQETWKENSLKDRNWWNSVPNLRFFYLLDSFGGSLVHTSTIGWSSFPSGEPVRWVSPILEILEILHPNMWWVWSQ